MARMVPDAPVPDTPSDAEIKFFRRLREQLSDDFVVYHSVTYWIATGRDSASRGEVDFVVLHPDCGMLVVEVKGGGVTWDSARNRWLSEGRDGTHTITDPFKQAQRGVRALKRLLSRVSSVRSHAVSITWAVALPDCRADQAGLAESPLSRRLIDVGDLRELGKRVGTIFRQTGSQNERIPKRVLRAIEQHVLARYYELVPTLSSQVEWERQSLDRLTEPQSLCLDFLELNRRCLVRGPAGTGKTVIAIEYARRLAASGQRVVLACYNRPLACFLHAAVEADVCRESILVGTFHEICERLAREAGLGWNVPQGREESQRFWDEDAALLLTEALEKLPDRRFDHLVVDEGQDMNPDWWEALCGLLQDRDTGGLVIFCDPRQNIYRRKQVYPVEKPVFPLRMNCRNTRAIADFFCRVIGEPERLSVLASAGEAPVVRRFRNPQQQVRWIERDVRRLLEQEGIRPDQIAILGPHRFENSSLADRKEIAGLPLVGRDTDESGDRIRYSTLHRFKGLEADIVLLCDIDGDPRTCGPEHLYVAASRARSRLFVYAAEGVQLPGQDEAGRSP